MYKFLILVGTVFLMLSCNNSYKRVTAEELGRVLDSDKSNSAYSWYLMEEDSSFYYIERRKGLPWLREYLKVSKKCMTIENNNNYPFNLKMKDISWICENGIPKKRM